MDRQTGSVRRVPTMAMPMAQVHDRCDTAYSAAPPGGAPSTSGNKDMGGITDEAGIVAENFGRRAVIKFGVHPEKPGTDSLRRFVAQ